VAFAVRPITFGELVHSSPPALTNISEAEKKETLTEMLGAAISNPPFESPTA
jgi:hypothetical protein